jgi:hypothetical protein
MGLRCFAVRFSVPAQTERGANNFVPTRLFLPPEVFFSAPFQLKSYCN